MSSDAPKSLQSKVGNGQDDTQRPQTPDQSVKKVREQYDSPPTIIDASPRKQSSSFTSKIVLTSHPGQAGVDPLPMNWGDHNPDQRGPVVVSRHKSTIRRRNGMYDLQAANPKPLTTSSNWRSWWLLCHIPCSRCGKQRSGC